jgi:ubiquinone/menaquinone biosynthesis C-methylase UbiE
MSAENPSHTITTAYNRWAAQYDSDQNATRDLDREVLQNAGLLLANRHVLEIGCGTGKNTDWISSHARATTAIDFSEGMLAVARERITHASVQFVRHDIREPWPVETNSIDVVIGNLVLEHIEHLAPVYAEAARVLRDGGQLYFCELHPFRQLRGGQAHFTEQASGEQVKVTAFIHSVGEYINSAIAAGFALRHVGEWLEQDAQADAVPRLLSVQFTIAKPL